MSEESNKRKRTRSTEAQVQHRLHTVYALACNSDKVELGEMLDNQEEIIKIRCPLTKCNTYRDPIDPNSKTVGQRACREYEIISIGRDGNGNPISFKSGAGRTKFMLHLRDSHRPWYDAVIEEPHQHMPQNSCATGVHEEEDYYDSVEGGGIATAEEEELEDESEDMFNVEPLDDVEETMKGLPTEPCRTTESLLKYINTPIGGGLRSGVYSGRKQTILETCLGLRELKHRFMLPLECLQCILILLIGCMGGVREEQYIMPPSVHLLASVLGDESLESKEIHMCHCCYQYPPVDHSKTDKEKKEETCPDCFLNRYDIVKGRLLPALKMYYFGVRSQIEALFRSHIFRQLRTKGRTETDGIYKSKSITEDLRGIVPEVLETSRSIYSIAIDGAQPFKKRVHSSTKIVLRCEDLPLSHRCKGSYSRTLALIPGPKEPSDHNPYLCVIAREFNDLMENGMKIKYKNEDGEEEETMHYPIFRFIFGDAKAMEKTYQYVSCTAKIGCRFCTQTATQYLTTTKEGRTRKVSRMTGFTSPATFLDPEPAPDMEEETTLSILRTHDAVIPRRNREQVWKILNLVKDAMQKKTCGDDPNGRELQSLTERYGWKGFPKVFQVGKALDIVDSTPLPIFHNLLLGVVKNFLQYIYDGLAKTKTQSSQNAPERKMKILMTKKDLEALQEKVFYNSSVKKPYSGLSMCYSWISEEVGVFLELHSTHLFDSEKVGTRVISEEAEDAWHLLKQAVLYYFGRPTEENLDMNTAHEKLLEFARLCEKEGIMALVKPNLHTAICRLREQEKCLGHLRHLGELWMERALRYISSTHSVSLPDQSYAKMHLEMEALERHKYHLGIPNDESIIRKYQPRKDLPRRYNTISDLKGEWHTAHDGTMYVLLFKGAGSEMQIDGRLNTGTNPIGLKMGELWKQEQSLPGNSKLSQEEFKRLRGVIQYKSLIKEATDGEPIGGIVKSKSQTKERKRKSYIVEIPYQATDQQSGEIMNTSIAEIDIFFMIARVDRSGQGKAINIVGDQQRYAMCHVFKTSKVRGSYILDYKRWESAYLQKNVVIPVSDIGRPVNGVTNTLKPNHRGEVIERMVFTPHDTEYRNTYYSD